MCEKQDNEVRSCTNYSHLLSIHYSRPLQKTEYVISSTALCGAAAVLSHPVWFTIYLCPAVCAEQSTVWNTEVFVLLESLLSVLSYNVVYIIPLTIRFEIVVIFYKKTNLRTVWECIV